VRAVSKNLPKYPMLDILFVDFKKATGPQWFNYRRHADIGFFKNFDFMVDMGSFNIQTNKKI
jgi:hypothetical protein